MAQEAAGSKPVTHPKIPRHTSGSSNDGASALSDEPVINTVAVLLVTTSILGPMLTERYGRTLAGRGQ